MRTCVILVGGLLVAGQLAGQEVDEVVFRAGAAISELTEQSSAEESRWGIVLGADVGLPLTGSVSLRPGVYYVGKGTDIRPSVRDLDIDDRGSNVDVDGGLALDYLQFQLPAQATLGSGGLSVYALAGPWYAFRIRCRASADVLDLALSGDCDERGSRSSSDLGIMGGLGLSFRLSERLSAEIDGVYHAGLSDVLGGTDSGSRQTHTRTRSLRLGLVLRS